MRSAALLAMILAGCAARAPAPPVQEIAQACRIRPVSVSDRDFISRETRAEIRRVNRDLRRHCAG